jgi:hypothetical protein
MITCKLLGKLGRFGNQLYQIAGVIGVATKNNQSFCFPQWVNHDHKERFGSSEDISVAKYFQNHLPEYREVNYEYQWIDWGYRDITISHDRNIDLCGHFQSPKYFDHCIDRVRFYLTMVDEYAPNDYCAIHWRAGDYIDDPNAYHPRMRKEYYDEAKRYMPEGTKYLVFTDSIEDAKNLFGVAEYYKGDYIDSFKMMKACKHFIISNSSYSAMAATLSTQGGIVVSPKKWFGLVAGITGDDIHEKHWRVI